MRAFVILIMLWSAWAQANTELCMNSSAGFELPQVRTRILAAMATAKEKAPTYKVSQKLVLEAYVDAARGVLQAMGQQGVDSQTFTDVALMFIRDGGDSTSALQDPFPLVRYHVDGSLYNYALADGKGDGGQSLMKDIWQASKNIAMSDKDIRRLVDAAKQYTNGIRESVHVPNERKTLVQVGPFSMTMKNNTLVHERMPIYPLREAGVDRWDWGPSVEFLKYEQEFYASKELPNESLSNEEFRQILARFQNLKGEIYLILNAEQFEQYFKILDEILQNLAERNIKSSDFTRVILALMTTPGLEFKLLTQSARQIRYNVFTYREDGIHNSGLYARIANFARRGIFLKADLQRILQAYELRPELHDHLTDEIFTDLATVRTLDARP